MAAEVKVGYSAGMPAEITPKNTFALGIFQKAARGDRKVGGYAS